MRRLLSWCGLLMLAAGSAEAQVPARDYLIGGFERQKAVLLKYVDVMPDSGMGFRPTPGVRSYVEQLEHIAQATAGITARLVTTAPTLPALPAKERYLADRAALRAFVAGSFDAAIALVRAMSDADLTMDRTMFGITNSGWQWVIGIQEHSAWTLGATVPYLRMNGVTPPQYIAF